jgi:hypothetical protein
MDNIDIMLDRLKDLHTEQEINNILERTMNYSEYNEDKFVLKKRVELKLGDIIKYNDLLFEVYKFTEFYIILEKVFLKLKLFNRDLYYLDKKKNLFRLHQKYRHRILKETKNLTDLHVLVLPDDIEYMIYEPVSSDDIIEECNECRTMANGDFHWSICKLHDYIPLDHNIHRVLN